MNITIVCIGKLKEKYWREAVAEYSKRLGGYCSLTVKELKEAPLPSNPSPADEEAVKKAEGYLADICLIYAMISFLAVVVLCRVYISVYLGRKKGEDGR